MNNFSRHTLLASVVIAGTAIATPAAAQQKSFDIPAQPATSAITTLARQADVQIVAARKFTRGKTTRPVRGAMTVEQALSQMLDGTGLRAKKSGPRSYTILAQQLAARIVTASAASTAEIAVAQPEPQDEPDVNDEPETPGDIVITAQKREERLMEVPIAVTAVTGNEIEDKGYDNVASLLQRAPGVSTSGESFVQIRGIASVFGAANVGYYLDELPFSFLLSTQLPDVRTWDLDRVEILRGPQGTLYGANSMGGTIRTLTKNPNLTDVEVKGEAGIGFIKDGSEEWEVKGALNMPLVEDRVAIRIAGTHYDTGGFVDAPFGKDINDNRITTLRGKVALVPVDGLRITLSAWSYDAETAHPSAARRNRVTTNTLNTPSSLEYQTYGGVIEYEGPGFDVVSSTSYLNLDLESTALGNIGVPVLIESDNNAQTFSQEVRLVSSASGPFRWTAGGFYQHSKEVSEAIIPGIFSSDTSGKSKAWALFGEGTYDFGALEATLGLRYYRDKRTSAGGQLGLPPLPTVNSSYDTFNPKFGLAWHARPNSLFYANVAKGFRSGQIQPVSSLFIADLFGVDVPTLIDPETLWSYEIGNKTSFLDGRLTVEGALYYNDWKDLQVTITAGGIVGALINAGKAHSMGADLAISYRPIDGLTLTAAGNINESKLDSTVPTAFDKGDRIVFVPKYTFNTSATYVTPISDSLNFFGYAEFYQAGRHFLKAQGFAGESDPQSMLNMRVGVEARKWGVYLTAHNLLDERGFTSPSLVTTDFNTPIPQPRTFGVLLRARY